MSECKEVVIIIRPSFKKMCEDDACRAAVLNHFLYWIARKVKSGADYWYGSFEEIWESLDRSWGLSKTIQEIKALVADGFIGQRRNPKNGWDQTRHYYFGKEQAETLRAACEKVGVCLAHIGLSPDVLHLLNLTNAFNESNKCICSNQQIDLLDLPDRFVESNDAIPKVSTKDYNKGLQDKEREDVAPATARSQTSSPQKNVTFVDDEETEKRGSVNIFAWTLGPMLTPLPVLNLDTEKLPTITPLQKDVAPNGYHHQRPIVDRDFPADSHQPEPVQPEPRQKPQTPVTVPKRPKQQPVTMPEIPAEATAILDRWDSINKKPTPRTAEMIKDAILFVSVDPTAEEMKGCKLWLFTTDDPKRPWYRKIGVGFHDVVKNFSKWQSLQDAKPPGKEESNGYRVISSFDDPNFNMNDEFYPSEKEKKAYSAAQEVRS